MICPPEASCRHEVYGKELVCSLSTTARGCDVSKYAHMTQFQPLPNTEIKLLYSSSLTPNLPQARSRRCGGGFYWNLYIQIFGVKRCFSEKSKAMFSKSSRVSSADGNAMSLNSVPFSREKPGLEKSVAIWV